MGIKFFYKEKLANGKTKTIQTFGHNPTQFETSTVKRAEITDRVIAPLPVVYKPEQVEPPVEIHTVDLAISQMVKARPDVLSPEFENDFLGVIPKPLGPTVVLTRWQRFVKWIKLMFL